MLSATPLAFMKTRIMDIQQALFFNDSQSVLKFPISIINVLQVDEVGQIWFMVHRPSQNLKEFDNNFHSKLDFYKKGKSYYLHVRGKAWIVTDPEEINTLHGLGEDILKQVTTSMVLIRMKVSDIQYYPSRHHINKLRLAVPKISVQPSALVKSLQYIIKDIIPVFQSH